MVKRVSLDAFECLPSICRVFLERIAARYVPRMNHSSRPVDIGSLRNRLRIGSSAGANDVARFSLTEVPEVLHWVLERARSSVSVVSFGRDDFLVEMLSRLSSRGVLVRQVRIVLQRSDIVEPGDVLLSDVLHAGLHPRFDLQLTVDDGAVVRVDRSGGHVSGRGEDIAQALRELDVALAIRPLPTTLEEYLLGSADLIAGVSEAICSGGHVDSQSCGWYHSAWQYLRLMDVVSTPAWHHDFYLGAFESALEGVDEPNVLISGTADYSLPAYVSFAAEATQDVSITVIDRCETPLFACKWLAAKRGEKISTIRHDVLESLDRKFDLITADAFLTRFDEHSMHTVLANWAQMSHEETRLVTTVRIHEEKSPDSVEAEIAAYLERVQARSEVWERFLRVSSRELVRIADRYIRRMVSNSAGCPQQVLDRFGSCGLTVLDAERATVPGELRSTEYLRIVAAKRPSPKSKMSPAPAAHFMPIYRITEADMVSYLWEKARRVADAVERNTEADLSWHDNIASAVFAHEVLEATGRTRQMERLRDDISRRWRNVDRLETQEYGDFQEIARSIGEAQDGPNVASHEIDLMHRSWLAGLVVTIPSLRNEAAAALRTNQLSSGAIATEKVPWITARAILGLTTNGSTITNCDITHAACQWLSGESPDGARRFSLWPSGTGRWNSDLMSTAMCASALVAAEVFSSADAEIVSAYVMAKHPEWSQPGREIDAALAIDVLLATGTSWRLLFDDILRLLAWTSEAHPWARLGVDASESGEETSKLAGVASFVVRAMVRTFGQQIEAL